MNWAKLLVTFIGKLAISAADNLKYIVALELYATNLRGAAVSLSSMCGRVGATISPFVVLISQQVLTTVVVVSPVHTTVVPINYVGL